MENNKQTRKEKHAKKHLTKKLWRIICAAAAAAAAVIIIIAVVSRQQGNDQVYQDLKEEVVSEATTKNTPEPTPTPTMPISKQTVIAKNTDKGLVPSDRYIDFTELEERNGDIIGWITVDGTEIEYPILKSRDNADYLLIDVDGNENVNGSIFMDMANRTNYSDRNTVIYGHNMKNGSMFAQLHNFEDEDFFNENREIKVYTRNGMRVYEIVAAYLTNDDNILYANDFTDDEVWLNYIEDMLNNDDGNVLDTEIGLDDRIITLSTCQRGEAENRFLVVGVLKQNEE